MLKKIILPDIGEGIDSVEVTGISISVGDVISNNDIIITVETEKASMEIPADASGTIEEINISKGDTISSNTVIATIALDINDISINKSNDILNKSKLNNIIQNSIITILLPNIGEGIDEVEVTEINVKVDDLISTTDSIITVETEKASMDIPAKKSGIIKNILVNKGDTIKTGHKLLLIEETSVSDKSDEKLTKVISSNKTKLINYSSISSKTAKIPEKNNSNFIYTSPSVRRFSRKLGCDLTLVTGTGPKGRILKENVEKYISNILNDPNQRIKSNSSHEIDFNIFGLTQELKLNKIRRTIATRLQSAWNTIPQVTQFDKADITELDEYRKSINNSNKNIKLSFLPLFIKALLPVLKEFPDFNSSLSSSEDTLIIKKYFNIGIAVDTPNGLLVPVIKNIDQKSIFTIMEELVDKSKRARNKKIKPDELEGACITISSLGGIGGTYFTPIINPPEVAIIGISKAKFEPVLINNKTFEPRKILPLSLTYDHRVIDGAIAARFTTLFSNYLTNYKTIPGINE